MEQTATPRSRAEPAAHRSLALSALLQQLVPERKYSILDLGRACGDNIDFWSRFPSRIYIPDFYRSLESSAAPSAGEEEDEKDARWASIFEEILPYDPDCRFDIVLGWDVFNYLDPVQLQHLLRRLSGFCSKGSYIFLLISTLQQIPVEPNMFRILDSEHLTYENRATAMRACPRYQPRDIKLMMAGFEVLVSFLLRNGIQEYLFVRQ